MIPTLATRIFQMIFAIIVLALSIRAAKWQLVGKVPTTTAYSAFAGAFAILVTLIGFAAMWLTAIPKIIMSGLDGLASILLLAGGIAYVAKIANVDCGITPYDSHDAISNELLNGGCVSTKRGPACGYVDLEEIAGRCKVLEADSAFLFLGFGACVGAAVLCFLAHKRGSTV